MQLRVLKGATLECLKYLKGVIMPKLVWLCCLPDVVQFYHSASSQISHIRSIVVRSRQVPLGQSLQYSPNATFRVKMNFILAVFLILSFFERKRTAFGSINPGSLSFHVAPFISASSRSSHEVRYLCGAMFSRPPKQFTLRYPSRPSLNDSKSFTSKSIRLRQGSHGPRDKRV